MSITFMTNAATVQHIELTDAPVQFLDQKKKTPFKQHHSNIKSSIQATKLTDSPTLLFDQNKFSSETPQQIQGIAPYRADENLFVNTPVNTLTQREISNSSFINKFKSFTKMLDAEYGGNALVHDSLSTLYEAKQLWQQADSQANAFASDIIFSLKLDKLIENDLSNTQKSLSNSSLSILSNKSLNLPNQEQKRKDITFYQVKQAQANTSTQDFQTLNTNFLNKLFRIKTLYYLAAFFIFFSIVQFAIKFYLRLYP